MITNQAYMKASKAPEADNCLTPQFAILPILKYLKAKNFKNIWCPFDKADSLYVRVLQHYNFSVQYSHIDNGQDFFNYIPPQPYDCIVSNPPFSKKVDIVKRLYSFQKPFMILLPQNALQNKKLTAMWMKNGVEYLGFDNRISFYTKDNLDSITHHNFFASGYFCHDVLPEKLMFEVLNLTNEGYTDSILDISI